MKKKKAMKKKKKNWDDRIMMSEMPKKMMKM